MKSALPLLLLGGAAVVAMGGKKKGKAKPKHMPQYVFYASGKNIFARGALAGALELKGLNTTMYDQRELADAYDDAWANADGLIVALDIANEKLAGAWAAPAAAAGKMAKGMTLEELGTKGVQEAVALAHGATTS